MSDDLSSSELHHAFAEAAQNYLASRRERVKPFTRHYFSFKGALRLNRKALGKDLLRTPANIAWMPPYLFSRGAAAASHKLGMERAARFLGKLPPGFKTDVEKEVEWLIYSEFLELPIEQENRRCTKDALLEELLVHPSISPLLVSELEKLNELAQQQGFRQKLEAFLRTYTASRTAAAELSGNLLNLAAGVAMFQKFTPGALSMGNAAAAAIAHHLAVSNFILGSTLGSVYYGIFPATVSTGLLVSTVGGLMVMLSILTSFSGIITDPIQQALGLHDRKLYKLVDALEKELKKENKGYRIYDAYASRVLDLLDLLKTATRTLA